MTPNFKVLQRHFPVKSPQDPLPWESDTLDVSGETTVKCIQDSSHDSNDDEEQGFDADASEDCLYLNIYRQARPIGIYL